MTLVLIEGFEDYAIGWTTGGTGGPNGAAARHGVNGALINGASNLQLAAAALLGTTNTWGFAARLVAPVGSTSQTRMDLADSNANVCAGMWIQPNGSLQVVTGAAQGVRFATAAGFILPDTWYYFELRSLWHRTAGTVEVRVNGTTIYAGSGFDTGTAVLPAKPARLYFGTGSGGVGQGVTWVDDMYLCNDAADTLLGDCQVETIYPNGAGDSTDWSRFGAPSNWQAVDEVGVYDPSDYVKAGAAGQRDLYQFTDLVAATGTLYGVEHVAMAANIDAAGTHNLKLVHHHATDATQTFTLPVPLSSGGLVATPYTALAWVQPNDPDTGAPWLAGNVNALQAGVEVA